MNASNDYLAIVTGASSGIGLAMARRLLEEGYSVIGIARQFPAATLQHAHFRSVELDLADLDNLPAALKQIIDGINQPIRLLINNAGIGKMGYLEQLSIDDIRLVMDTNFMSHAIVTKSFLPLLKQQEELADIVFTGSEAALQGARQGSIYCASKFAIRGFVQALRQECARSAVRVTIINPGAVRSAFFDDLHFEPAGAKENAIEPADIAEILLTIVNARPGTVIDEINLSPQTPVWQRKDK